MFGRLFRRKLRSNQPIQRAYPASIEVQNQMKNLERIKRLNEMNHRVIDDLPDFNQKAKEMLRRDGFDV